MLKRSGQSLDMKIISDLFMTEDHLLAVLLNNKPYITQDMNKDDHVTIKVSLLDWCLPSTCTCASLPLK